MRFHLSFCQFSTKLSKLEFINCMLSMNVDLYYSININLCNMCIDIKIVNFLHYKWLSFPLRLCNRTGFSFVSKISIFICDMVMIFYLNIFANTQCIPYMASSSCLNILFIFFLAGLFFLSFFCIFLTTLTFFQSFVNKLVNRSSASVNLHCFIKSIIIATPS